MNTKKFIVGGVNMDDSDHLVDSKEAIGIRNMRFITTEDGSVGRMRTVYGNTEKNQTINSSGVTVAFSLPSGTNNTIGGTEDTIRQRIFYCNWNSNGNHGIYCYDSKSQLIYTVLLSSQVTGGLNFSALQQYLIADNIKVIGDFIVFTDGLNEVRCLNVEAGIKLNHPTYSTSVVPYVSPLRYETLTLIKKPPIFRLSVAKNYDSSFANNLTGSESFQFSYRYIYKYDQCSAMAEYSALIPHNYEQENYNSVDVTVPLTETIDDEVQAVELCVRYGNTGSVYVVKTFDKDNTTDAAAISAHNAGTTALAYRFYNNTTGTPVDSVSANNSADSVPLLAKTVEVARNRVFLSNILAGYASPRNTSLGLSYTDTSTPNTNVPTAVSTGASNIGFNTPSTIPIAFASSPITVAGQYTIRSQGYNACSNDANNTQYPTYPADTDCVFWNQSSGGTAKTYSFTLTAYANIYNDNVDSQISLYLYICGDPNTKRLQKVATWETKKGLRYTKAISLQLSVPPLTKVFLVAYPDLGVTGFNDNNIELTTPRVWVTDVNAFTPSAPIFKTGGSYKGGVAFYDRFKRRCAVVTKDSAIMNIPRRTYTTYPSNTAGWTLSNASALTEIPSWAYYYQVLLTKEQNETSYAQFAVTDMRYVKKDIVTGLYVYDDLTYSQDAVAVGINMKALIDSGLGYSHTEGDMLYLFNSDGKSYSLKVLGVYSDWIHCVKKDIGTLGALYSWMAEVYSPRMSSVNEIYYGASPILAVSNPTTNSRAYASLSGSLVGDTYFVQRSSGVSILYKAEAMNPNDLYWTKWERSIGFPSVVSNIKPIQKENDVAFSDAIVLGTKINGINTFQALNIKSDMPSELGGVQKLVLASKQEAEGTVMLAIGTTNTASMYLGETQIFDNSGASTIAKSNNVIGNVNILKGGYGTVNPESVIKRNGVVRFFDANRGCYVRYDNAGLYPISDKKMFKYFKKAGQQVLAALANPSAYSTINPFVRVVSGTDPFFNEWLVNIPRTSHISSSITLDDMVISTATYSVTGTGTGPYTASATATMVTGAQYKISAPAGCTVTYQGEVVSGTITAAEGRVFTLSSASPFTGNLVLTRITKSLYEPEYKEGGTWCYSPDQTVEKWCGIRTFVPEWMLTVGNRLVAFKDGKVYIHDSGSTTFFGQTFESGVAVVHSEQTNTSKLYTNIAIEGVTPDVFHIRSEVPYVQSSDLIASDFKNKEGVKYSEIYRDRLSPNVSGTAEKKLKVGDKIRAEVGKCMVLYNPSSIGEFKYINIFWDSNQGHTV